MHVYNRPRASIGLVLIVAISAWLKVGAITSEPAKKDAEPRRWLS